MHLVLTITASTDRDPEPEVKFNPVAIPIDDPKAQLALEMAIAELDKHDATPGDGSADFKQRVRIPVKVNLFVTRLNTEVAIDATASLHLEP